MKLYAIVAALLLMPPGAAHAEPVQVHLQWDGNDLTGGVLVTRVRGLLAASSDKREVRSPQDGLSVIIQTIDPANEWQDKVAAQRRITVYSLTINRHYAESRTDLLNSTVLGYCGLAEIAGCAREIVDAIDEQIARSTTP